MRIYLAQDPATGGLFSQNRPLVRADFPPGGRGLGWPQRYLDIDDAEFDLILAGGLSQADLDLLQQGWWGAATPFVP